MDDARTDDDLMLAYARGEARAFEVLYERYRQPLYRYLLHALGDRAAADDLYQDVWSRIIDARARFRKSRGFKRYAFRIAHNRLVDHWRALERQGSSGEFDELRLAAPSEQQPDSASARDQQAQQLRQALMQLSTEQREAFLLQQEAGLSLADIAAHSGVGRETVKSRLRYAVKRLRNLLGPGPEAAGP
ncbi:sigma-70 family RNA polymerase sigma factor [Wenzhouxiangella limi]|uniref:Sigma-70 family RNA polymerase sigma factor n=1 Tax=Wenzhouxiangella limi TaxID=2707351 RepID=A0A845UYE6_9GAMM|nr:sigma-70 family RNA polymerase sigma factor [Wenzhouxiangella limi]NDY95524.1 sigma-70 family RNA polymerase sigma factor [Wenzhouxiangella limi]